MRWLTFGDRTDLDPLGSGPLDTRLAPAATAATL